MSIDTPPEKTLRQKAEERLRHSMTDVGSLSLEEARKLAHELQVHQVELEMQNEELRQVMEDLEASQRRFFTLFNQAPVGYLVLDEVGIVQQVNETFCEMVQRGRDEIIGHALADWIAPPDRQAFLARYRAFYKSPQLKNFELRLVRTQGGGFYARLEGQLVSGDFGRPKTGSLVHLLLTVSDITARKEAEEALRQGEERFRTLFEGAAVGILDAQGVVVHVSQRLCDLLGYAPDDLIGKTIPELTYPDDRASSQEMFDRLVRGEIDTYVLEKRYLCKDGGVVWANANVIARRDSSGALQQAIGIIQDIGDRKRAEQEVEFYTARLQSLVRMFQYQPKSIEDFLEYALEEVLRVTQSAIGFISKYDAQRREFSFKVWSRQVMQVCAITETDFVRPLEEAGLWGEVVRQLRPIIVNDFQAPHPLKKGYPDGHAELRRFMGIPVVSDGRVAAVVGVANKESPYDEGDVLQLTLLMDAAWKVVERMEAVEAVRQGEERFRALFEGAAVGISDAEGVVVRVSQRLCDLLGYAPDALIGKNSEEITHPEDRALHRQMKEKMQMQQLDSYVIEKRYLRKDGGVVWVNLNVFAVRDSNGKLMQRIGVTQDITPRKLAEQALQEERQRFQDLFEHAPVAIWLEDITAVMVWMQQRKSEGVSDLRAYFAQHPDQVTDVFGLVRVLDVNQAAVEMNAAHSKQHLLENLAQTITEATVKVLIEELAALWEGKLHFEMETQSRRLDGRPLFTISRFDIPLVGEETGGQAAPDYSRMVFTAVDITALKNAERTLIAQEKLTGIGTLAAGMAHEINSPLQVVTGVAESLKKRLQEGRQMSSQDMIRRLDMLADNAWRIRDIVRSMLDFTAGAAGEVAMHSLNDIVSATLTLLESQTKTWKNVMIEPQLDENLPQISCDRNQIMRVLISLLNNAHEAMPHGGRIGIQTTYDPQTEQVYLRVIDSGLGVPEGIRKRIFDPFFTTKPVGSGMGLGLSVTASILRAHGGDIELESTSPQGSVFKVSLPLTPPPPSESEDLILGRYT
ncbi:MAG: PAS domain S-box protein [Anaerolineae bacterium]|nr:PAS domain S-box protein [Anaerolineae bacterium]